MHIQQLLASYSAPIVGGPVTWSPSNKGSNVTLSGGNLAANVVNDNQLALATAGKTSGKWYWEILVGTMTDTSYGNCGTAEITQSPNVAIVNGFDYQSNGSLVGGTSGASWTTGDVLGFTLELVGSTATVEVYKNNVLSTSKTYVGASNVSPAASQIYGPGSTYQYTFRPDAATQTYSPPAGFSPYS